MNFNKIHYSGISPNFLYSTTFPQYILFEQINFIHFSFILIINTDIIFIQKFNIFTTIFIAIKLGKK